MKTKSANHRAMLLSLTSLLIFIAMLVGTTFAWFTDSVTSAGNIIKSGKLDVEMYWADGAQAVPSDTSPDWEDASQVAIFNYDLWEPGFVQVRHIKIANVGNLALKYKIAILPTGALETNANGHTLAEAIDVYYIDPAAQIESRADLTPSNYLCPLTTALSNLDVTGSGELYPVGNPDGKSSSDVITIALKMREDAGNEYQNMSLGADFAVQLIATQLTYEPDSFNNLYDDTSVYPSVPTSVNGAGTGNYSSVTDHGTTTATTEAVQITVNNAASQTVGSASVPAAAAGAVLNDYTSGLSTTADYIDDQLTLTLNVVTKDTSDTSMTLDVTMGSLFTRSEGTSATDATVTQNGSHPVSELSQPVTVTLNLEPNLTNVHITHSHTNPATSEVTTVPMASVSSLGELADGKFYYNSTTGELTLMTSKFSEFLIEYVRPNVVENPTRHMTYSSLTAASADASSGDRLVLNSAITDGNISKPVILDLNGFDATGITANADCSISGNGSLSVSVNAGTLTITGGQHESVTFTGDGNVVVAGGSFREANVAAMTEKITAQGAYLTGPDTDSWYNYTLATGDFMVLNANGTVKALYSTIHAAGENVVEGGTLRCIGAESVITIPFNHTNSNIVNLAATCTVDLNGHTVNVVEGHEYPVFNGGNPSFKNGTILNEWNGNPGCLVTNQSDIVIENVLFNFDPIYNSFHASAVKLPATCVIAGDGTYLINPTSAPEEYAAKIVRHYDKNLLFNNVKHPFQGDVTYYFTGENGVAKAMNMVSGGDELTLHASAAAYTVTLYNGETLIIHTSNASFYPTVSQSPDTLILNEEVTDDGLTKTYTVVRNVEAIVYDDNGEEVAAGFFIDMINDYKGSYSTSAAYNKHFTIMLNKDLSLTSTILIGPSSDSHTSTGIPCNCTIDLNGHSITGENNIFKLHLSSNSTLEITDSSDGKTGRITCTGNGKSCFYMMRPKTSGLSYTSGTSRGVVKVCGGTIESTNGSIVCFDIYTTSSSGDIRGYFTNLQIFEGARVLAKNEFAKRTYSIQMNNSFANRAVTIFGGAIIGGNDLSGFVTNSASTNLIRLAKDPTSYDTTTVESVESIDGFTCYQVMK